MNKVTFELTQAQAEAFRKNFIATYGEGHSDDLAVMWARIEAYSRWDEVEISQSVGAPQPDVEDYVWELTQPDLVAMNHVIEYTGEVAGVWSYSFG